jgi:hypothetical protein
VRFRETPRLSISRGLEGWTGGVVDVKSSAPVVTRSYDSVISEAVTELCPDSNGLDCLSGGFAVVLK